MEGDYVVAKHRIYEIAQELEITSKEMIKVLEELGMGKLSPLNTVDEEEYELILDFYNDRRKKEQPTETATEVKTKPEPEVKEGPSRPPVISVLGHIDHGKTTLLDSVRETNLTSKEVGGITQSIGAYQIEWDGKPLTFIDTPGHKAFTAMRARGAQATDIAVLVIAADDGIMNQTEEAINHIEAAGIPMIVAINKIDKTNADVQQVLNQLAQHDLTPDEWGGDVVTVSISALKGENIDELLDMVVLLAQMEDLRGDPEGELQGFVVESHLDSRKGPLATAVVKQGTLRSRDILVVGNTYGRIRTLSNESGTVEQAGPGAAVEIMGLKNVPQAGSSLERFQDFSAAKELAKKRQEELEEKQRAPARSVEDLFERAQKDRLELVVKANTVGALDAVGKELEGIERNEVEIDILHEGIGDVSESDIMLAASSDHYSAVLGFGVGFSKNAKDKARQMDVTVETYDVIYDLVERIEAAVGEIKGPTYEEKKIGEVEVRQIFDISDQGKVAGCYVVEGKVTNDSKVKLWRNGEKVYEGSISTLKRFTDDVKEVGQDYECGIKLEGFEDVKEGDELEIYVRQLVETI